jgi:hypothetical protein
MRGRTGKGAALSLATADLMIALSRCREGLRITVSPGLFICHLTTSSFYGVMRALRPCVLIMAHLTYKLSYISVLVASTRQPALKIGGGLQVLSVRLSSGQAYINQRIGGQVPIRSPIGLLEPRPQAGARRSRLPERLPDDAQAGRPGERTLRPIKTAVARPPHVRGVTRRRPAVPPRPPAGWCVSSASSRHDVGRIAMVPAIRVREQRWPR